MTIRGGICWRDDLQPKSFRDYAWWSIWTYPFAFDIVLRSWCGFRYVRRPRFLCDQVHVSAGWIAVWLRWGRLPRGVR